MPGPAFDPEVALAIAYAPRGARPALTALWALDSRLAAILRSTRDPTLGQLRLTWWHDAVGRTREIGGEPVLAALNEAAIDPAAARLVIEGWEALLDGDDVTALNAYADGRGGGLFAAAARVLGASEPVADAGAGWALVDLARHHSRPEVAQRALAAAERLGRAPRRWSRPARPLGALAKLARRDLPQPAAPGAPARLFAVAWLALTGR